MAIYHIQHDINMDNLVNYYDIPKYFGFLASSVNMVPPKNYKAIRSFQELKKLDSRIRMNCQTNLLFSYLTEEHGLGDPEFIVVDDTSSIKRKDMYFSKESLYSLGFHEKVRGLDSFEFSHTPGRKSVFYKNAKSLLEDKYNNYKKSIYSENGKIRLFDDRLISHMGMVIGAPSSFVQKEYLTRGAHTKDEIVDYLLKMIDSGDYLLINDSTK